ncbi:hypothetical protein NBO_1078g0002 [Nosema bombycis CQ1]|uniref:Uncharacterized protein n=1 Tax=Nosema bombycis (strain CQ1 / CVCC 102059) TaxID=578461 RepID=R0M0I7_NOSB1|nr:hypothetical protein NBO_1078g0002 [Nosema bombycis CQ1]|eukprot:EOB11539.1 hypothetical protein NBO_1078g0002 [Nosema bombycis CQ1]
MNPIVFDSLHRYAIKNNLDEKNLFKTYSNYLFKNKNYLLLLEFMSSCDFYDVKFDFEFVEYLIKNYEIVKSHFNEKFCELKEVKYILCFIKMFKYQEEPTSEELYFVFDSPFTSYLLGLMYESTRNSKKHCGRTISKCLDFLYEKEKDLNIKKDVLNLYKSEFVKFWCMLDKEMI